MKKLVTICAALVLASAANAQSQRLVLLEEFTQASCGPCAAANPFIHSVLVANTTPTRKMVGIKYQTSWPGVDPMNAHNPTEVQTRVDYYNVQGVPEVFLDGATNNLDQTTIDAEYAVPSPFDIALSHVMSNNFDSIYVTMTITCTQATSGTYVGQIGVVEEEINFATAPGANGEKDFYGIMKKMLPDANGTTLPTTWTVGQTQTITQSWKLANVYNVNTIAVTAWVQNDANKEVAQVAYSVPIPNPNFTDAALTVPSSPYACTSYSPTFSMANKGGAALTSCAIEYSYDNGATQTYNWTGNLAYGATTTITLPSVSFTAGTHSVQITATNTNITDILAANNQKSISFFISTSNAPVPVTEAFANSVFPNSNWFNADSDGDGRKWMRATAGHNGAGSAKLDYYNIQAGSIDDLYLPVVNMTTVNAPQLTFDVAHKQFASTYSDKLEVNVSTNCGATWTTVYQQAGADLASVSGYTGATEYTPVADDWRLETVDLASYANETNLLVRFRGISAYGNNIYIDNVNLFGNIGIFTAEELASNLSLAPNPANETVKVDFSLHNSSNVAIQIINTLGQVVFAQNQDLAAGVQTLNINTANFANGTYTISLISDNKVSAKSFVVAH